MKKTTLALLIAFNCTPTFASSTELTECVMRQFSQGDDAMTLKQVRALCHARLDENSAEQKPMAEQEIARQTTPVKAEDNASEPEHGLISQRILSESKTAFEPDVITPHRLNYILPAYATNQIHKAPYESIDGYQESLADVEAKFQLSLKVPLNRESLLIEGDGLYLGFTLQAWWQVYAAEISRPFRESNYQPEIFYIAPLDWQPFGGNTGFVLGLEHQSNGQRQLLSRSWNRLYGHFLFEKDNFALSIRPWHRLSEDEKEFEFDPDGDDNPDIEDYMGHFELGMVYKWQDFQLGFMGRQNFSTNRGAAELGLTFPLWGKLRGYATAFSGYGESLIDYNHSQTRFGVGISLNDIL